MTEQTITEDDDGIRLDRWFKRHYPDLQHAMLEKNLRKGDIRLDGKKAKSSDRIAAGQVIDIRIQNAMLNPDKKTEYNAGMRYVSQDDTEMMQRSVLYKDANIIVINKPYGLPVQGGSKIRRSIDDMLDVLTFDAKDRPKLVHRLDRDTSGVLVLARSTKVAAQMMKLFAGRTVEKTYWALVNHVPEQLNGTINLPLIKKDNPKATGWPNNSPDGRDYEIMQVDENGQSAKTEYRVVEFLARRFAWMELKPLTGRMHQLRVHMQAIGCPIVGDHKYGGGMSDGESLGVENILHLHARRIVIPALPGGKIIDVTAPLPEHMQRSFKALGIEVPKK